MMFSTNPFFFLCWYNWLVKKLMQALEGCVSGEVPSWDRKRQTVRDKKGERKGL